MMRPIFWMCIAALVLAGCGRGGEEAKLKPVASHRPAPFDESKPVVRFGVISWYNPVVMYEEYQPVMDYLTSQTPYKFELKLGKTYEDAVKLLEQGVTQIASLGAVTYLEAHARFGAVPILRCLNGEGEPFYHSIAVVRKDSDIQALSDLNGRSFCFPSPHSTAGNLFGRYMLAEAGVQLQDLKNYTNFKYHDEVAKAVLSGKYDAGAVKDLVARRYEPKGLRFLLISEPIPGAAIVVRKDVPPAVVLAVKAALLRLRPEDPDHRQMMGEWSDELKYGFIEATDRDYQPVREMLNAIPERCGDTCHPSYRF